MAFTTIIRRSVSTVVPLAIRVIGNQRHHHHCADLFSVINHSDISRKLCPSFFPSLFRHYSSNLSSSNGKLLKFIESEIKCTEESDDYDQVKEVPDGFPFKIQDNPGLKTITLTREYQGDTITVEVHMPDVGEDEDGDGDDDDDDSQTCISLVVRVSKKTGPSLEFGCTAFSDEIAIDSLLIKYPETAEDQIAYEGPDFADLNENMQKAFHEYLRIRGIKPRTTNFLYEYMLNKDRREYITWLKNLKKFMET